MTPKRLARIAGLLHLLDGIFVRLTFTDASPFTTASRSALARNEQVAPALH